MNSKLKFLIAGGTNTAITFGLYALLVLLGLHYNLALAITYLLGIVIGFIINRSWTFSRARRVKAESPRLSRDKSTKAQFIQYLLVYLAVFIINFLILNLLVRAAGLDPIISQLVAVAVSTVFSYLLQRSWVFSDAND